jgi:hypothetical protein
LLPLLLSQEQLCFFAFFLLFIFLAQQLSFKKVCNA